jgi:putative toxin-antitoxin system antitoxin component (TIGR02293 family)
MLNQSQVREILGGPQVLGREPSNLADFDALVRDGLPWASAHHVKKALELSDELFADWLETSQRTLARWKKSRPKLSLAASDRLYRLAAIVAMAREVFEDRQAAMDWLRHPQVGLGGRTPLELAMTEPGAREVENLLGRLEYGVVS